MLNYKELYFPYRKKDTILFSMIFCYVIPIIIVGTTYFYDSNTSVSNIICNDRCKNVILVCMILMGGGTILYEIERNDPVSIVLIFILLAGIYGLISIKETDTMHYVFAFTAFASILGFMIQHVCKNTECIILLASFLIQIALLCSIILNIYGGDIFFAEIVYILNFAFFYLYLHFT